MNTIQNYNKKLRPFASSLRKTMTKSEACLWKFALKAGKMKGYGFKRQRPILNYIADFFCDELKLVIEVDGSTHDWEETYEKDQKKQQDIELAGYRVLRFSDEDVLRDIDHVIYAIEEWIEKNHIDLLRPAATSPEGGKYPAAITINAARP